MPNIRSNGRNNGTQNTQHNTSITRTNGTISGELIKDQQKQSLQQHVHNKEDTITQNIPNGLTLPTTIDTIPENSTIYNQEQISNDVPILEYQQNQTSESIPIPALSSSHTNTNDTSSKYSRSSLFPPDSLEFHVIQRAYLDMSSFKESVMSLSGLCEDLKSEILEKDELIHNYEESLLTKDAEINFLNDKMTELLKQVEIYKTQLSKNVHLYKTSRREIAKLKGDMLDDHDKIKKLSIKLEDVDDSVEDVIKKKRKLSNGHAITNGIKSDKIANSISEEDDLTDSQADVNKSISSQSSSSSSSSSTTTTVPPSPRLTIKFKNPTSTSTNHTKNGSNGVMYHDGNNFKTKSPTKVKLEYPSSNKNNKKPKNSS